MCIKTIEQIEKSKVIVIVRGVEKEKLLPLCEAMYKGGIRLLELTYDATGKTSAEETAENIRMLAEAFEGRMYIGAGTVLSEAQVELTKKVGGRFSIHAGIIEDRGEGMAQIMGTDGESDAGLLRLRFFFIGAAAWADRLFTVKHMGHGAIEGIPAAGEGDLREGL